MTKPAPLPERIESYEQYEELLARLVAGAQKLSNPLLEPEQKKKMMVVYDRIDALITDYQERMRRK